VTISNREIQDEFKQAQAQGSGQQLGGGPGASDRDAAGGSSGTGGYGNAQNQSFHQGQTAGRTRIRRTRPGPSCRAASASIWSRAAAAPPTRSISRRSSWKGGSTAAR